MVANEAHCGGLKVEEIVGGEGDVAVDVSSRSSILIRDRIGQQWTENIGLVAQNHAEL
jgi:hypothetical protein